MELYDQRRAPALMIVFGLWILWGFGWTTVGERLRLEVDGTIIASRDVPNTGAPRYATQYSVHSVDGSVRDFSAGATDASLPRHMPVGTRIRKERWHLDYERNGRTYGFPYIFYSVTLIIAFCFLVMGIVAMLLRRRKDRAVSSEGA